MDTIVSCEGDSDGARNGRCWLQEPGRKVGGGCGRGKGLANVRYHPPWKVAFRRSEHWEAQGSLGQKPMLLQIKSYGLASVFVVRCQEELLLSSRGLPIVSVCASPLYRHHPGHRHSVGHRVNVESSSRVKGFHRHAR